MGLLDQVNRLTDGKARLGNNVYCTLANYPALFIAWMQLGSYLFRHSSLPPRKREKMILRTAALSAGCYPFAQHVGIGRECGLKETDLAGVLVGPTDPYWQEADQWLLTAADELIAGNAIADLTWNDLRSILSVRQCLDLVATVAFYRLAAWTLNVCRTPFEDKQTSLVPSSVCGPKFPDLTAYRGAPASPSWHQNTGRLTY